MPMRTVVVRLLPDGSGRVRIHWFERLDNGPVKTPEGEVMTNLGPMVFGGVSGRIACAPKMTNVSPQMVDGRANLVCHSDEVRAVTCPQCMETEEFKKAMEEIRLLVDTANPVA